MQIGTADGRIFLDVRGPADAPPLLYLHGGPGMGCREFMAWQGERLGAKLRVFGLDQRGAHRSDKGLGCTEDALVDDCEALRESLGLDRWAVLGHSFGGRIALRYAVRHPEAVSAVLFENPAWDLAETERHRLPAAAAIYEELGDPANALRCRTLAEAPSHDRWESIDLLNGLNEHNRYYDLYVHQSVARAALAALESDRSHPTTPRSRDQLHGQRLVETPDLLGSMVPMLSELRTPAMLIKGRYDLVAGPDQVAGFADLVADGQTVVFEQSSHFVQLEEPDRYANLVVPFTLRHHRG